MDVTDELIVPEVVDGAAGRSHKPRNERGTEESINVRPAADAVTEAMSRVAGRLGNSSADAFVSLAARVVLKHTEWK